MKKNNSRSVLFFAFALALTGIALVFFGPTEEVGVLKLKKIEKQATKKARADFFERMLRDPVTKRVPANIRHRELLHAATMPKRINGVHKSSSIPLFSWNEAGPTDVGGRTRAIAIDINNSNTILAGGVAGGIWKSTNGGDSWTLKTDPANPANVTYIAQDPRPGNQNRWLATTGEFSGSNSDRGFRAFYYGRGVYESTDNGESWQLFEPAGRDHVTFDSAFDYGVKILVNPSTGTVFMASNGFGLNRATGSLSGMSMVLGSQVFPYWTGFDIASDGTILAVISDGFADNPSSELPGVYRSTNDGDSFDNITPAGFTSLPDRSVVAFAPSNPNVAYVLTFTGNISSSNNAFEELEEFKLYKFDVGAGTSQDLSANLPDFGGQVGDLYSQGGYDMTIAVKPNDENHVLIAGTNIYASLDGFATQPTNATTGWVGGYSTANNISQFNNHHADQHILVFDPQNPNALWSGHDGGLSYVADVTTNSAYNWQSKNNGFNTTQYYHISLPAAGDDNRILGGTQDNGSPFFSFDPTSMITTSSDDVSSGDGAFAYMGENYAIASSQNGDLSVFSYSGQGDLQLLGNITPASASGQLFINPFAIDPIDETIIYYPADRNIWRRSAGNISSNSWSNLSSLQLGAGLQYSAMATAAAGGSSVLYLGASGDDQVPQVYRFDNASTSTSAATNVSIPSAVADAYIHSIAVNPSNANEVLVGMSNYKIVGLYHTNDAGASWTAIEGNLLGNLNAPGPSIRSVAILPMNSDTGYLVGTSTGFYSTNSLDGSNTVWQQEASDELGNVIVESIAARPSDGRVALATHGRGAFIGMPLNPVANEEESALPGLFTLDQNYPNPFNPTTNISFNLAQASQVTLKIVDIAGREVRTLLSGVTKEPGAHQVPFIAEGLPSGTYLYQLEAVSLSSSKQIHKESKTMTLAK